MAELVRTVGRYGILREVGRGGMAVVHLARQLDLDRLVALKELAAFHASDPDFARRFVRESRLAGSLMHPNIVTVFDYFEHEGTPYIAMEYLDRGSLRPHVGRMTPAQIGGVLEGLLAGLAAAEQRGIVHRDLKPENLMVTPDGGVKIADFGIAKATQASGTFATATGSTVGTPHYMAPEQAMAKQIGSWTDIYAVGCIAHELFTGRPPYHDADSPMAIMLRHINEPLPAATGADPEISRWIARLTAKEPADRPASASEAWEELEEILIAVLGPRWRRGARLGEVPAQVPGPATPPPTSTPEPVEGIDLDGTGPDTGGDLPPTEEPDFDSFETYVPRTTIRPPTAEPPDPPPPPPLGAPPSAGEPPAGGAPRSAGEPSAAGDGPPTPPAGPPPVATGAGPPTPPPLPPTVPMQTTEPPAPAASDRAATLARSGAVGLVAALLAAVIADDADRFNLWAVLSPLEAAGLMAGAWLAAERRTAFAAGVLTGAGGLACVAALALVKFTFERLGAGAGALALITLLAGAAILAAGTMRARTIAASPAAADPATLLLGLAGAALAGVALFTHYDGFSSLWSEVGEVDSAEFFFEPAVAVAAALVTLVVVLGTRPRLAAGLLVAIGGAGALHFLGLIVAAWRAIGEVGEIRSAGFIGVLGCLLLLGAGAYDARR